MISKLLVRSSLLAIATFTLLSCCSKKANDSRQVLIEKDKMYAAISSEKGMNTAFLAMFDSAAVMLSENHQPIEGYQAIKSRLLSRSDSTFTLTWEPRFAKIAASGELGYTYGIYQVKDKVSDSVTEVGKYVTIWIKETNGEWKAILDTGNAGLGENK